MEIAAQYSHLNGFEWIQYHQRKTWNEIVEIIQCINADDLRVKVSKEETMRGKLLYSPKELNKRIKKEFGALNWQKGKTRYWVTDDYKLLTKSMYLDDSKQKKMLLEEGKELIRSSTETSFIRDRIAVEVQFGKYSFIASDLYVKHAALYLENSIDVAIEILPMKVMNTEMSSGPGYYEGALYDLARQGRSIPAVPLVLVGIQP
jgi:hypothetical protein